MRVAGIAGWGPGELLKDQPPAGQRSYPSGVIELTGGKELLTVAQVQSTPQTDFDPVSSTWCRSAAKTAAGRPSAGSMNASDGFSYATGRQLGDTVYVAATDNGAGPIHLYEIPAEHITDRGSWEQYRVDGPPISNWGATPQMAQVGDQWVLSYIDGGQLVARVADSPGDFGSAPAQTLNYPDPPGVGAVYGGYVQPDSTPDDLRFGVSYYNEGNQADSEPYGIGEWRYRPQ